ncbi:FAD-dependent oxidoreductase [Lipingzhangella sp. LS1_29]|uniref:FAD-dependent oxidoreductase n=1 Tax=Lipingzhangella rawalii TaxID=2055835 RepID=A0ABU2HB20_9ACTN|nr:FAD-dependent oxidoreductase [Lipingzhangella rawalii]MDS1271789.1 FAD-dependent oxidoreductase [Lipingzhangella rawalii]
MRHRIVVLGAGYAGLIAAKRIAAQLRAETVDVTLVNADPDFVERIRLHQVAANQQLPRRPLVELLHGTCVQLVVDRVVRLDVEHREVELAADGAGRTLGYDTLVYALGSVTDTGSVPGAAEHTWSVSGAADAAALRQRLAEREAQAVAVVGGGLTGIETATELAESYPEHRVMLLDAGRVGGWLSTPAQRHLRRVLDRLDVEVRDETSVSTVNPETLITPDGTEIPADTTVWAAGFRPPEIAREAGLAVTPTGRIQVDATMRSRSHPEVYAVGDAAAVAGPGGAELRMCCAAGSPMAGKAADVIAARLTGRRPGTFWFRFFGQCVSLGRNDGLVQLVRADDTVTGRVLTGRKAARVKEFISRGAAWPVRHPGPYRPVRRRPAQIAALRTESANR